MASEALTCVTVYSAHVNGHINTAANPNWRLTKKKPLLIWHQSSMTSAWTHRESALELCMGAQFHTQSATPPCPLVTTLTGGMRRGEQKRGSSESSAARIRAHKCAHRVNTNWHTFGNRTMSVVQ